jgi:hypothetical protein
VAASVRRHVRSLFVNQLLARIDSRHRVIGRSPLSCAGRGSRRPSRLDRFWAERLKPPQLDTLGSTSICAGGLTRGFRQIPFPAALGEEADFVGWRSEPRPEGRGTPRFLVALRLMT